MCMYTYVCIYNKIARKDVGKYKVEKIEMAI